MKIDKPREYVVKALRYAFKPESVAVVGASNNPGKDTGENDVHGLRTPIDPCAVNGFFSDTPSARRDTADTP